MEIPHNIYSTGIQGSISPCCMLLFCRDAQHADCETIISNLVIYPRNKCHQIDFVFVAVLLFPLN